MGEYLGLVKFVECPERKDKKKKNKKAQGSDCQGPTERGWPPLWNQRCHLNDELPGGIRMGENRGTGVQSFKVTKGCLSLRSQGQGRRR